MNLPVDMNGAVPAALAELPGLLEELEEHFEYEYVNLEGTTGLTGYESDEDVAGMEPGTEREIADLRKIISFRERIAKLQQAIG